jgi:hypothetical protein
MVNHSPFSNNAGLSQLQQGQTSNSRSIDLFSGGISLVSVEEEENGLEAAGARSRVAPRRRGSGAGDPSGAVRRLSLKQASG